MSGRPPHWPDDVEPLAIDELDKLGRNRRNELFWDGRRLRTQYSFTWPQTLLALLAAIASLATIGTGLNNFSLFLCARDVTVLGCPRPPTPALPPSPTAPKP